MGKSDLKANDKHTYFCWFYSSLIQYQSYNYKKMDSRQIYKRFRLVTTPYFASTHGTIITWQTIAGSEGKCNGLLSRPRLKAIFCDPNHLYFVRLKKEKELRLRLEKTAFCLF